MNRDHNSVSHLEKIRKLGLRVVPLVFALMVALVLLSPFFMLRSAVTIASKDSGITFQSFSVSPTTADWNQTVTLTWNVTGAVSLKLSAFQSPQHGGDIPNEIPNAQLPAGSYQYHIPDHTLRDYSFQLVAINSVGRAEFGPTIKIQVRCPYTFFSKKPPFGTSFTCPSSAPTSVLAVYQPFEHGSMIWDSENNTIV